MRSRASYLRRHDLLYREEIELLNDEDFKAVDCDVHSRGASFVSFERPRPRCAAVGPFHVGSGRWRARRFFLKF